MLKHAVRYAQLGIPVFPCAANQKIPATANGFKDATCNLAEIRGWDDGLNIGTPTGQRWWVLDIDTRHGGDESLMALQDTHGPIPATLTAKTPSGGSHMFFAADARAVNTASKLGPGLDTRGAGGYVLIEGSFISGNPYQFFDWDVFEEMVPALAKAPEWLMSAAFGAQQRKAQSEPTGGVIEGGRNVYLTQHAGKLRRLGYSPDEILAALGALNVSRCRPHLSEQEVRTIAASVGRYPSEAETAEADAPRLVSTLHKQAVLEDLWEKGLPPGFKTGWPAVDAFYTVVPGQLSIVTGWPNSGKSEWVDALLVNLSRQGWRIAYFSPENMPVEIHMAKIIEKLDGRPFGAGRNDRVAKGSIAKWSEHMANNFRFLEPAEGSLNARDVCAATLPWLKASDAPCGLVIDPWNELEHWRPQGMSETEYVSATLSEVRQWARAHKVHVWIVAHPQKVKREDGALPVPKPDMISGSQHWWNKADCCVTVYRDMNTESQDVDIYVQKVRFKHVGRIGKITLKYDRVTGRYAQPLGIASYHDRQA